MEHITTCEITLFIIHCNLFYIYNSWSPLMACLFKLFAYYEWLSLKTKFIANQDFLTAMKDLQLLLELKSSCWTHHKVAESTLLNTCVHWHTSAHACTHIQIHPPNQTIHQSAIFNIGSDHTRFGKRMLKATVWRWQVVLRICITFYLTIHLIAKICWIFSTQFTRLDL